MNPEFEPAWTCRRVFSSVTFIRRGHRPLGRHCLRPPLSDAAEMSIFAFLMDAVASDNLLSVQTRERGSMNSHNVGVAWDLFSRSLFRRSPSARPVRRTVESARGSVWSPQGICALLAISIIVRARRRHRHLHAVGASPINVGLERRRRRRKQRPARNFLPHAGPEYSLNGVDKIIILSTTLPRFSRANCPLLGESTLDQYYTDMRRCALRPSGRVVAPRATPPSPARHSC